MKHSADYRSDELLFDLQMRNFIIRMSIAPLKYSDLQGYLWNCLKEQLAVVSSAPESFDIIFAHIEHPVENFVLNFYVAVLLEFPAAD